MDRRLFSLIFYIFWKNFLGSFCHYAMLTFLESKKKVLIFIFIITYFKKKYVILYIRMGFAFF